VALGGSIKPPIKTYFPQPRYTEEARQAQVQGVVILEAVIDAKGNVSRVKVLKGLAAGLTASATETAKQWKFKPATLEGKPVAVFFVLTISFSLQ
jgi:protein TonB